MRSQLKPPPSLRPAGKLRTATSDDVWKKRALAALAMVAAAALLSVYLLSTDDPDASSLDEVALVGNRGPGCVRLVIASDQSGSMTNFAAPSEQALKQLLNWTPQNLRADDEIAVLAFTDHAESKLAPVSAVSRPVVGSIAVANGSDTLIDPVISAVQQLPTTPCRTALLLLSDGRMSDLSGNAAAARARLRSAAVSDLLLLAPGNAIKVPDEWTAAYPYAKPVRFDGNNPEATGLAFGNSLAAITGQSLEKKPKDGSPQ